MLPETTALKLSNYQWRAASINDTVGREELAAHGFLWQQLLGDGSAIYSSNGASDDNEFACVEASAVHRSISFAGQACSRPLGKLKLMAIVNLTEDSFSDGGTYQINDEALRNHCQQLIAEGADILDFGAESTRPNACEVDDETQIKLLSNAMRVLSDLKVTLSIDTRSSVVARHCLQRGANIINDVSAFGDKEMPATIAEFGAQVVLMHSRGTAKTMRQHCDYDYLIGEICDELSLRVNAGIDAGIDAANIIIDPGIGFAKTAQQNFDIIGNLRAFRSLGFPVLAGPSRKSFISSVLPHLEPQQRDGATMGAASVCAYNEAEYLRLHSGGSNWDAVRIAQACN